MDKPDTAIAIDERARELTRAASLAAEAWAVRRVDELRAEGRQVAGGWPGTMSEARACVRAEIARERLSPATHVELEQAARSAYARARDLWLARAVRDDEDGETATAIDPHAAQLLED